MSTANWIHLHLHPDGPEVTQLASLTGGRPNDCFAAAVRWFWFVDTHLDQLRANVDIKSADLISRWRKPRTQLVAKYTSIAEAMTDPTIGWLSVDDDGTVLVEGFEKHFGNSAKRRSNENRRKARSRLSAKCPQSVRTAAEQKRPKSKSKSNKQQTTPLPPKGEGADWDGACSQMETDTLKTDAFCKAWAEWSEHRKEIRKPIGPRAVKMQIKKLEEIGHDRAIAAIEHSIASSYTGIFEPRAGQGSKPQRHAAPDPGKYDDLS